MPGGDRNQVKGHAERAKGQTESSRGRTESSRAALGWKCGVEIAYYIFTLGALGARATGASW